MPDEFLYIVVTKPNNRDTSMCNVAVRVATNSPVTAMTEVRKAQADGEEMFISMIYVFRVKLDHGYKMSDFARAVDEASQHLVYIAHNPYGNHHKWLEYFRGEFERIFGKNGEHIPKTV